MNYMQTLSNIMWPALKTKLQKCGHAVYINHLQGKRVNNYLQTLKINDLKEESGAS
jgi:hypothetical protein